MAGRWTISITISAQGAQRSWKRESLWSPRADGGTCGDEQYISLYISHHLEVEQPPRRTSHGTNIGTATRRIGSPLGPWGLHGWQAKYRGSGHLNVVKHY